MKAMILAAGRGERMRPLTDHCPKPLLAVAGKPLIAWHLERLQAAGFSEVLINHAHLGSMIEEALGDGSRFALRISYSAEPPGALETAGGIRHALPFFADLPFLVINGDIFCDWPLERARQALADDDLAHLVLVANPPQHANGDFWLHDGRIVGDAEAAQGGATRQTFAGIGIYRPQLFSQLPDNTPAKLAPLLFAAVEANCISGELHSGKWVDVGTPERLAALDRDLTA
jgi:N-acetyl-alpha-D-muramate 1-phosphate uridylyltransferase